MKVLIGALLILTSCNPQGVSAVDEPATLENGPLEESELQRIRSNYPGMSDACANKLRAGGINAWPKEWGECIAVTPARRWSGLWRNEFEGSKFCPAPSQECSHDTPGEDIFLFFSEQLPESRMAASGGLYAIEFVGRRTINRGKFGHLGMSDHEMIVDRVISMRDIKE